MLFPVGLMKFRGIFRTEAYVPIFLILGSNLFHSLISYGKKEHLYKVIILHFWFCTDNIELSTNFYLVISL